MSRSYRSPYVRAVELRRAANRLRRDVEIALGTYPGMTAPHDPAAVGDLTLIEIAETMAILRHTLTAIEQISDPSDAGARERFAAALRIATAYYEVPR